MMPTFRRMTALAALLCMLCAPVQANDVPPVEAYEQQISLPTEESSPEPAEQPSPVPTEEPSPEPTEEPSLAPTEEPSPEPTEEPSPAPTEEPYPEPTEEPSPAPTEEPSPVPTEEPYPEPTEEPSPAPTEEPSPDPTAEPSPTPPLLFAPETEPAFTITLPAALKLSLTGGEADICATGVTGLAEGQELVVSVSSANGFLLRSDDAEVAYVLSCDGQPVSSGGTVARFTGDGVQRLDFEVSGTPAAGLYTDTLTFTVSPTGGDMTE